jgi:hypothetical protein
VRSLGFPSKERPLLDPETVLFVDDHEAQFFKGGAPAKQRVSPYCDVADF